MSCGEFTPNAGRAAVMKGTRTGFELASLSLWIVDLCFLNWGLLEPGVPRRTRRCVRGAGGRLVRCVTLWMNDLQAEDVPERVDLTIAVEQ
jgi:hypothetical protein